MTEGTEVVFEESLDSGAMKVHFEASYTVAFSAFSKAIFKTGPSDCLYWAFCAFSR